jgi:hypothetical protein
MTGFYKDGFLFLTINGHKFKLNAIKCIELTHILIDAADAAESDADANTNPTDLTDAAVGLDIIPTFGNPKFRF